MFGSFLTGKPREAALGFNALAIVFNFQERFRKSI
jgi:hypothetical protein